MQERPLRRATQCSPAASARFGGSGAMTQASALCRTGLAPGETKGERVGRAVHRLAPFLSGVRDCTFSLCPALSPGYSSAFYRQLGCPSRSGVDTSDLLPDFVVDRAQRIWAASATVAAPVRRGRSPSVPYGVNSSTVASELVSDVTVSATTFATIVSRHVNVARKVRRYIHNDVAHKGSALSRQNRASTPS
jgi:hypothetical protein